MRGTQWVRWLAMTLGVGAVVLSAGTRVDAAAEVKLDREFLAGLIEKMPPCPFQKAGQYRGTVRAYRLIGIDPGSRRFLVGCQIDGEFRPPAPRLPGRETRSDPSSGTWKNFRFDVKASVNMEPGVDGVPKFRVDVEEVKRQELEGLAGLLARFLGTLFDDLVTQIAHGKASLLSEKLNAQLLKRVATFREYGVLCGIDYAPAQVVLHFDLTRLRREGIAGYVFATAQPGTVPLYRWVHRRLGSHFYGLSPSPPNPQLFQSEGIACFVFERPLADAVPFYQWHGRGDRFYTVSAGGDWVRRAQYRLEGVVCFICPGPRPGTVPLYQFIDPRTGYHFYTLHPHAEFAK